MTGALRVLPFLPRFHEPVRDKSKTMTARTKKYGKVGDLLQGPGCILKLTSIREECLETIAREFWKQEGCRSPFDFQVTWQAIHPRLDWDGGRVVWLHEFVVVSYTRPPDLDAFVVWWECCGKAGGSPDVQLAEDGNCEMVLCPYCGVVRDEVPVLRGEIV